MALFLPLLLAMPPAAMAAISVSLAFAAIFTALFFMAAYALQNPQLIAVSKEELSALIFSVVIIMFWLSADSLFNTASSGLLISSIPASAATQLNLGSSGALSASHVDIAYSCLDVLFVKLRDMYINLYLFEVLIGFLSTISFPIGSPVPAVNVISLSLAPFSGLVLLSNAHTTVVEAIGYTMTLIWAKQFILLFCRDIIPILMLPLGLVLRAFPFFRTTGSSLISICFAGYFVLPFAIILSNYMIFDLYEPAEFAYTPEYATVFSGSDHSSGDELSAADMEEGLDNARNGEHTESLMELFNRRPASEEVITEGGTCQGNVVRRVLCGGWNVMRGAAGAAVDLARTAWNIGLFMVGMTGDFFWTAFNNPLMPASVSAGLFYFIIQEVATLSQFLILVIVTSIVEIIITITMYRNIAMLIGGELEIAGLTKII
ncbi:MAG: hypothetical protein ABII71_00375 [Candidatus Micrarchaeota archaeon]